MKKNHPQQVEVTQHCSFDIKIIKTQLFISFTSLSPVDNFKSSQINRFLNIPEMEIKYFTPAISLRGINKTYCNINSFALARNV